MQLIEKARGCFFLTSFCANVLQLHDITNIAFNFFISNIAMICTY